MKIAICLYGHYRTFDVCSPSWNNFYDRYNPDIFVSSWSNRGTFIPIASPDIANVGTIKQGDEPVTPDDFRRVLGPRLKDIQIDRYEDHYQQFIDDIRPIVEYQQSCGIEHHGINVHSRYSQAYKIWSAEQLLKNETYDIVILTRPDIHLADASASIDIIDPSCIAINELQGPRMVHDLIRYGSQDTIHKIANLYKEYHTIVNIGKETNDPHICFDVHGMLHYYITEYHKLQIVPPTLPVGIWR